MPLTEKTARRRPKIRLAAALAPLAMSCAPQSPPADPQFVAEWMRNYYGWIRAERISPPVASRVLGDEAALSRLYGGIHYPMGNENGKALGRCIGRTVLQRLATRAAPLP